MKQTMLAIMVLCMLVACSTNNGTQTAVQSESIKVGWISPLTGPAAVYGVPALNAAKLAVEDVNAKGGINGRQLELIVEDGKCDGAASTTAATKLVDVDGVKYILGGHCSTESMSIVPVTESRHVFLLAGTTGTDKFTNAGKLAFRTFPTARQVFSPLADRAARDGTKTVAILNEQKDWPQSAAKAFSEQFIANGGTVLDQETFAPGTTDFRTQLLKMKELHPDALMISCQGPDTAAQIIQQLKEIGLDGKQIYGDAIVVSQATYEKTKGIFPESALATAPYPKNEVLSKQVLEAYTQKFGKIGVHDFYITENYDAVHILADLIGKCGDDVECARTELLSKTWPEVSTDFTFEASGDTNPFIGLYQVKEGKVVFLKE